MDQKTIRKFRKHQRLTQAQLAALMNVNQATISRWETGTERIPADGLSELETRLFCDRRKLDPFVNFLLKSPKMSVVEDSEQKIVCASSALARAVHRSCGDLVGENIGNVLHIAPHDLCCERHCPCRDQDIVTTKPADKPDCSERLCWRAERHDLHLDCDRPMRITFMEQLPTPPCHRIRSRHSMTGRAKTKTQERCRHIRSSDGGASA